MNPERWQKVKELFDAALEIESQKRGKFLENACGNDVELRREVEKLLASFENAESFMESPAAAEVAGLIIERPEKLKSGDAERATQLAGAAEHLRESFGCGTEPAERRFRDACLVELQSVLDKENFAAFYEQGRALSLKKAIALALRESAEDFKYNAVGLNAQTTDKSP